MNILTKLLIAALLSFLGPLTPEEIEIQEDRLEQHQTVGITTCNLIEANACFLLNKKSPL